MSNLLGLVGYGAHEDEDDDDEDEDGEHGLEEQQRSQAVQQQPGGAEHSSLAPALEPSPSQLPREGEDFQAPC